MKSSPLLLSLVALLAAGCIFGGSNDKDDPDENNTTNNTTGNNSSNNQTSNNTVIGDMGMPDVGTPDLGTPDVGMPDAGPTETYVPLNVEPMDCDDPRTLWFQPGAGVAARITADSAVVSGAAPVDVGDSNASIGDLSVGHATLIQGTIHVYAAAAAIADEATGELTALHEHATTIDVDAEVLAIVMTPGWINRTVDEPVGTLEAILLATSAGVYDCFMTLDRNDVTDLTCAPSQFQPLLDDTDVPAPARLDTGPIFEDALNGAYGFNLANPSVIVAVSGRTAGGGEGLALLRNNTTDGTPEPVGLPEIEPELDGGEIFAERAVFGVEATSFKFPLVATLGRRVTGGELEPLVLRSADTMAANYVIANGPTWELSSRLAPAHGTFTFVDGYEITTRLWLRTLIPLEGGLSFQPGDVSLGYAGITRNGNSVIFSRRGGFGATDYLQLELPDATELAAFKNIPVPDTLFGAKTSDGNVAIAIVHGAQRDRLAVLNWGFGIDAIMMRNLLADDFTNARDVNPSWFYSDAGSISLLAQRNGQWVNTAVAIPDLTDLTQSCR